jgi:hypothetical protein
MSSVKTQGTKIYFYDAASSDGNIVQLTCPTGITGLGGAADQIETTCLDVTEDRTYVRGLGSPGQISVPFNLDPDSVSQDLLFDLKASGDTVNWIACLSDGTAAPTAVVGGVITPPAGRTSFRFNAYVADVAIDIATNEIVRGTLTLQRSGPVTVTWG